MNSPLRMREIEKRVSDAAPLVRFMGVQKSYDGTTLVVKSPTASSVSCWRTP